MPRKKKEEQVEEAEVTKVTSRKRRIKESTEVVLNEDEKVLTQDEKDALL